MCFASGKMEIINKTTQAAVRKGISAHGAEIKSIARGMHPFVYTACVDNQVATAHSMSLSAVLKVAAVVCC